MTITAYLLIAVLGALIMGVWLWRFASRRHTLPCPTWLGWMVELDNPFTKTNRANTIIEHLDVRAGMAILDIGCGPGRLSIPLAKRVGPSGVVHALDIQAGMLQRAQQKATAAHVENIRFRQVDIGDGQIEESTFDRAILVTVLGEIPHREAAVKAIFSALKPGGVLSVTEVIFDPHFQRRSVVRKLAIATGFREHAFYGNAIAYTINFVKP